MKCRFCDKEAVYDDGLCEECHRTAQQEAKVMSSHERDSFQGQAIEEDGTVREQKHEYNESYRQQEPQGPSTMHRIITSGLSWRVKLALGVIVFCILAIIVSALGFLIMAMPYLIGIFLIYCVYNIVKSFLRR